MPHKPIYRPFKPPPLRTPSFLPEPVYADSEIPEAEQGLQGPPPALQSPEVRIDAPVPRKEPTALEIYDDIEGTRPPPVTGWRRGVSAFLQGGAPGLVSELVSPTAKHEQYARDQDYLKGRNELVRQGKQDDLTELSKMAQVSNLESLKESRESQAEDRDWDRETKMARIDAEEVKGPPPMTAPGQQPEYSYFTQGGKQYRRLTPYGKKRQQESAEQASWIEVTPEMEKKYGQFGFKAGQKVEPARVTQLINYEEQNGRAREANTLKDMISGRNSETRIVIAGMNQDGQNSRLAARTDAKSQDGPKLTTSQQKELADIDTTEEIISEIERFGADGKLEGVGRLAGPAGQMAQSWFGTGSEEAKSVRALVGNLRGTITKLRAGTALSKTEKEMLDRYVPDINENPASVTSKIQGLKTYLQSRRQNVLKYAASPSAAGQQGTGAQVAPKAPTQAPASLSAASTSVKMRGPNGQEVMVRAEKAAEAEKRGWKRVGQ